MQKIHILIVYSLYFFMYSVVNQVIIFFTLYTIIRNYDATCENSLALRCMFV